MTLIFSPPNIASIASAQAALLRESAEQRNGLVGDAVLRVVEVHAGGLERQPLAAFRILCEQVAEMYRAHVLMVCFERLPGRLMGSRPESAVVAVPSLIQTLPRSQGSSQSSHRCPPPKPPYACLSWPTSLARPTDDLKTLMTFAAYNAEGHLGHENHEIRQQHPDVAGRIRTCE